MNSFKVNFENLISFQMFVVFMFSTSENKSNTKIYMFIAIGINGLIPFDYLKFTHVNPKM